MTEELKPLPCPWCGEGPREKPNGLTACSNPHCGVFSINMTLEQWNTRSPAWRDDTERLHELFRQISANKITSPDISMGLIWRVEISDDLMKILESWLPLPPEEGR